MICTERRARREDALQQEQDEREPQLCGQEEHISRARGQPDSATSAFVRHQ